MTRRAPRKIIFAGLAFAGLIGLADSAWADWHDRISRTDIERLAHLEDLRADALAEAGPRGGVGNFGAVHAVLSPQPRAVPETSLAGNWRCRQIKLGGATGYYVFSWFNCRISRDGEGLRFEKAGTQRMAGRLFAQEGMWVYLGAQSARGEPLHRYGGSDLYAGVNPDDQVGVLVGIGNNHLRLDLPAPGTGESDFDTIELVR